MKIVATREELERLGVWERYATAFPETRLFYESLSRSEEIILSLEEARALGIAVGYSVMIGQEPAVRGLHPRQEFLYRDPPYLITIRDLLEKIEITMKCFPEDYTFKRTVDGNRHAFPPATPWR